MFLNWFLLTEVANDYSKTLNLNLKEDNLVEVEPESSENFILYSDGEISTTVDNNITESANKSKYFF